jgi:MSHA pilin protein MshC
MSKVVTSHSRVWRTQSGVTLVELIAVLIIIGVLGSIAATRYFDRASIDADTFTVQARAMLRYGQKLAIAQNRPVFARIDTNHVALCFDAACQADSRLVGPGATNSASARTLQYCDNSTTWLCEGIPDGVTQTVSGPAASFAFDALGKPHAVNADGTFGNFQRVLVKIRGDGDDVGVDRQVMVVPETGYVY